MGHIQADGIDIQTDNNAWPHVCDYNADGKKDLLVGQEGIYSTCNVYVYLNEGTNEAPAFGDSIPVLFNGSPMSYWRTVPVLIDLDLDGKNDMVLGGWYSDVRFYTNVGTNANPVFSDYIYLVLPDSQAYSNGNPPRVAFADWDGDSDLDMLTCDYYGSVFLRENVTSPGIAENSKNPAASHMLTVSPNPFSDMATISYQPADDRDVNLTIYDITGRLVKSFQLITSQPSVSISVKWDGRDNEQRQVPDGVYLATLTTGDRVETRKVLLIR
jgi:hypothetical protein